MGGGGDVGLSGNKAVIGGLVCDVSVVRLRHSSQKGMLYFLWINNGYYVKLNELCISSLSRKGDCV